MFADTGFSVQARILAYMEGVNLYNATNFSYEYNDASGGNFTGTSAAVAAFTSARALLARQRETPARPTRTARLTSRSIGLGLRLHGLRSVDLHRHQRDRGAFFRSADWVQHRLSRIATRPWRSRDC